MGPKSVKDVMVGSTDHAVVSMVNLHRSCG